jgi:polysaccharide export outer membrane protein
MFAKKSLLKKSIGRAILVIILIQICQMAAWSSGSQDYSIGAQDILKISVYEEPDLTKTVRVTTDGMISFPLLGNIAVAGLSVTDLEQKLTELLAKDYLVDPQVSVFIEEYHSKRVFVLGAVNKPGSYELTRDATILEMISRAGGITPDGGSSLVLLRARPEPSGQGSSEKSDSIVIDLDKLLRKGDISQNIMTRDKDVIHIPKADSIFVFGEVKNPGSFKLEGKDITVLQAITMAGGLTRIAAPRRTKVIRVENGKEKIVSVDLKDVMDGDKSQDVVLRAEDMVIVSESFF